MLGPLQKGPLCLEKLQLVGNVPGGLMQVLHEPLRDVRNLDVSGMRNRDGSWKMRQQERYSALLPSKQRLQDVPKRGGNVWL